MITVSHLRLKMSSRNNTIFPSVIDHPQSQDVPELNPANGRSIHQRTKACGLVIWALFGFMECPAATPTVLASNAGNPDNLIVDNSTVYWGDAFTGQIRSVSKNPGGTVTQYLVGMDSGGDLVQDNASLYFVSSIASVGGFVSEHPIYKMSKTGGLAVAIGNHDSFGGSMAIGPAGGVLYYHGGFRDIPKEPGDLTYGTRVIASLSTLGGSETVLVWDDNGSFANAAMDKAQLNRWLGSGFMRPTCDSTYLYWTDSTRIWRMPLVGVSPSALVSARTGIQYIATPTTGAAAGSIFWTEGSGTSYSLMRRKVGGEIITVLTNITSSDRCFAVDNDKVICEQSQGLVQVSIDGGAVTVLAGLIQAFGPLGIAVDSTYVYWGNLLGQIMRVARPTGGVVVVAPAVKTLAASGLTFESATLNGSVDAKGSARDVIFDYGLTTAYGMSVAATPANVSGSGVTPVNAAINNLLPHKIYHCRVRASGTLGADMTFTTADRAPTVTGESLVVLPGAVVVMSLLVNDSDPDGDTLSITALSALNPATAGKLTKTGNSVVFTASSTFPIGGATFSYTVSDGFGKTAQGTVTLTLGNCTIAGTATQDSAGGNYDIAVIAEGAWSAVETASWLSVAPASGVDDGTVTVTVLPNATKLMRKGVIVIGGKTHTLTQNPVQAVPEISVGAIPPAIVSGDFVLPIVTLNKPVTYTVTNLPPGLKLDNATGIFTGKPTKSATYHVTVKASNALGPASTPLNFDIVVQALSTGVIGTFHGLIVGHAGLNGRMGSRLELTTMGTGAVSGKIITGITAQPFAGSLTATPGDPDHPALLVSIPRKNSTTLTLDVHLDHATDSLYGELRDTPLDTARVDGWRNAWTTFKKASAYKGLHTFSLEQSDAASTLPQGYGFGSFAAVAETTGALTVSGRLADGSTYTTKTFIGQQGQVLIYQPLYGNIGSVAGWITVSPRDLLLLDDNTLTGTLAWFKPAPTGASTDTVYRGGIGPIPLTAQGAAYPVLPPGAVIMNLPDDTTGNARLAFSRGGLDEEGKAFDLLLSISNPSASGLTNKITPTATIPNNVTLSLLNTLTGAFSGEFTILGATTALNRKVTYQGQIVKQPSGSTSGYGYFLLPELPEGSEKLTTSPKNSGKLLLIDTTAP